MDESNDVDDLNDETDKNTESETKDEKETGRIEAFSDGVFAVAITLLVLKLKVPLPVPHQAYSLAQALMGQWVDYFAFLTSFLTILIMWVNHHRVFSLIKRSDDRFMIINGMLLLTVTVIPFTTDLLTTYLQHPEAKTAALVYCGTSFVMAICFNHLWRYASKDGRLLARDHDPRIADGITKSYRFGPLFYIVAILIACFNAMGSFLFCMLLAIYFTLPPHKHAGS